MMELVISIVSWNTRDLLRRCLISLQEHCRLDHTRVVVIDNASSDKTPEMVRSEFPWVTLIESGGNLGFGKAHNLISRHTTEPFILFLNPDTEFVEDAHEKMLEHFRKHPDVGLIGCRMINLDHSVQPLGLQWHPSPWTELVSGLIVSKGSMKLARHILPFHDPLKDGFVKKLYGGCLMARREILDRVGWFDERFFMYGEDVDLSRRVDENGLRLYYLSSVSVVHLCGGASAKAPGRFSILMQCDSIAKLMEKYYGKGGRVLYIVAIQARAIFRLFTLSIVRLTLFITGRGGKQSLQHSWSKHLTMLRWTLRLDHPVIPQ